MLKVVSRSVGVYGTAPTCFLSALARDPKFTLDRFNQSIQDRQLVRIRAMRYSVHAFPVEFLPIAAAATKRLTRKTNTYRKRLEGRYDEFKSALDEALADGPMAAADLRNRIDPERELGNLFSVALGMAAVDFRVVRTTTTGTWRSDRFLYARWQDWLPDSDPDGLDELEAMRQLVELYVQAYGPVTYDDVKWWTGWNRAETVAAIDGIDLERHGNALDDLVGVRLLPVWDVLMVAYRDRDRLFDPSYAPLIYDRYGNATSVVLDAGNVVGQWDLGSGDDPLVIKVAPFVDWPASRWDAVAAQAERIGRLLGTDEIEVRRIEEPVDLLDSSRNRFLAPLSRR